MSVALQLQGRLLAQTDDVQFENLSVEHGLSHPDVKAIIQDHQGFMWFGTADGLDRFDGHSVEVFRYNPKDTNSLSSSNILCLLEDDNEILWIGTDGGGLNSLNLRTGKTTRHDINPGHPRRQHISSLCIDKEGILWVGSTDLIGFDRKSGRPIRYPDSSGISSIDGNVVMTIHEDANGVLWVGTWLSGVYKIDRERREVSKFTHDPANSNSISENHVMSILRDAKGELWFGTYAGGLNRFCASTQTFAHYLKHDGRPNGLNDNTVHAMCEDDQGRLWIGTSGGGVNVLDRQSGHVQYLVHDFSKSTSLGGDRVFTIYEDRAGTLWFGANGVSKYSPLKNRFSFIPTSVGSGSFQYPAGTICEDRKGDLWISISGKGLTRYNREQRKFRFYAPDAKSAYAWSARFISAIYEDRLGFVWLGTIGDGLCRYDPQTGLFKLYNIRNPDSNRGTESAGPFYEDAGGTLWVCTSRSIASFDRLRDRFTYFSDRVNGGLHDPFAFNVQCILEEKADVLWLGTQFSGLIEYDLTRGVVSHFEHNEADSSSISSDDVRFIHRDTEGRLWLGTRGGGIDLYERETRSFKHLTERDGLLSDIVLGIVEDDSTRLWISTPKGLSCLNAKTGVILNYDAADGLSGLVEGSLIRSRTGEIVVGGDKGLVHFHPDNLMNNTHVPNIVLTAFNVLNEPYPLPQPIYNTREIVLDHTQNFFSFEFAALDYVAPKKNRYAYRLDGVDENWIQTGTRRYANYTHISPGKYVFHVKGSNDDGLWNDVGTSISIVITPPLWQTPWFRALAFLAVVALLAFGYNYRVDKLLELERVRLRIARDLHDELGSNLSGIALASQLMQEGLNLTDQQRLRLTEISDNALQTADTMREIIWFINPEHDEPRDLVLKMKDVAISMLGKVDLRFDADENVFGESPNLQFRRNLFLIYKEILNNIVRHAKCSGVEILLKRHGSTLYLSVVDNGDGFDPQSAPPGNGLKNLKARAIAMGGAMEIVSHPGEGTGIFLHAKMA